MGAEGKFFFYYFLFSQQNQSIFVWKKALIFKCCFLRVTVIKSRNLLWDFAQFPVWQKKNLQWAQSELLQWSSDSCHHYHNHWLYSRQSDAVVNYAVISLHLYLIGTLSVFCVVMTVFIQQWPPNHIWRKCFYSHTVLVIHSFMSL